MYSHLLILCSALQQIVKNLFPPNWWSSLSIYMLHPHLLMQTSAENTLPASHLPHLETCPYLCQISTTLGDYTLQPCTQLNTNIHKTATLSYKGQICTDDGTKLFLFVCRARDLQITSLSGHSNQVTESCMCKQ